MAMTPTFRSGGTLPSRPRPAAGVRPVYEDFRPITEWKQDEESNSLLLIYLPGFQWEHLQASIEGRNILRARGDRLVTGNIWSRFQDDYQLPGDCNLRGIHAKFEGGILTITIPRKREAEDASKEAAKATEDTPKPSQKTQEELSSQKQPSPPKAASEKMHQRVADDNSGPSAIPSVRAPGKGRDEKFQKTPPDQKMLSENTKKSPNEEPEKSKEESDYQKSAQKVEKLTHQAEDAIKKTIEESKAPDQVEHVMRETTEKPKSQKDKGNIEPKEKKTRTAAAAASSSTDYGLANYSQAVKNFLDLNEKRQLLVNVGAVVLVIVAFGAYLS